MTETDSTPTARTAVIGGYTAEMDGSAAGLLVARVVGAGADLALQTVTEIPLVSPSFVLAHPTRPYVFAVGEATPGTVSALRLDPAGEDSAAELVGTVSSGGDGGCHLALDPSGHFLLVAHYTSGSVASFRIGDDGSLEPAGLLGFEGTGPDPDRQASAHPHQVVAVGDVLLVPDLGADVVRLLAIDADGALTEAGDPIVLPAGSGPRHLVVARDHLLVTCELSAELWVKSLATDLAEPGRTVPVSGQEPASGVRSYPSALAVVGEHVVVANRGTDTLVVFALDADEATARRVAEVSAGGAWPRDLTVDGDRLWVADQADDRLAVFAARDAEPYLELLATLDARSPACIAFPA